MSDKAMTVWGGIAMMVAAAVWFWAGWMAGRNLWCPPILFVAGLIALSRGLLAPADSK